MLVQDKAAVLEKPRMGRRLHRYWQLCKLSFQERMEYRWNTLFFLFVVLLQPLVFAYLWNTVFNSQNDREAARNITTYYVIASYVGWRIATFDWVLMNDIRQGRIANYLLRPLSYPAATFWYEVGGRAWSTILTSPFFVVLAIALGDSFKPPADALTWLLFLLAFALAWVLSFFVSASVGLITVWQNQPEPIFFLYWTVSHWLGGALVPLALLPYGLGDWLQWLPFAYIYSLPVKIFQGLPSDQLLQGLGVQIVWLSVAALFFNWLWRKALKRYEVFEG